jgi:hypothetical protein
MKKPLVILLFLLPLLSFGQFTFKLKPLSIAGLPGLQSYSFAQIDGKIILIGGRLDGLHQRQPFASFAAASNNTTIYMIEPSTGKIWNSALSALPVGLQEQLQSTNMQYFQHHDTLILVGGYGYSATAGNHITFPNVTTVSVSGLANAIEKGESIAPFFKQITNQNLAVTGGHLEMLNDTFILVGGNRFDGRYNPMGNPTYTQRYTNEVKRFLLAENAGSISVSHYQTWYDSLELHRRDYNLTPAVFNTNELGFTAWSGVFRYDADLPYLNSVDIRNTGPIAQHSFEQKLNQYHTANLTLYDSENKELNTVFFGGIGQYYYSNGTLVRNDSVPFVKTISRIKRDAAGVLEESAMTLEMPGYLGASAEMVLHSNLPQYANRVIKWNELNGDSVSLGYIVGGINSTKANIFFINTGTQSSASSSLYEVVLVKDASTGLTPLRKTGFNLQAFPNPTGNKVYLEPIPQATDEIVLSNIKGEVLPGYSVNPQTGALDLSELSQGIYLLRVKTPMGLQQLKLVKN